MKRLETIKWAGTVALIAATSIRALNISHGLDVLLSLLGVTCWLVVGIQERDKPLWVVNGFSVAILAYGVATL